MSDTPQNDYQEAQVQNWQIGGKEGHLSLTVALGPLMAIVPISSRMAREIAIAVLGEQGPYLMYQPPNESMREHKDFRAASLLRDKSEPFWREAKSRDLAARRLEEIVDDLGERALGYALKRLGY